MPKHIVKNSFNSLVQNVSISTRPPSSDLDLNNILDLQALQDVEINQPRVLRGWQGIVPEGQSCCLLPTQGRVYCTGESSPILQCCL